MHSALDQNPNQQVMSSGEFTLLPGAPQAIGDKEAPRWLGDVRQPG